MIARGSDAEIRVEPARRRAHETKIVMLVGPRSRVRPTRGAFAALASLSERASAGRSCFRTARGQQCDGGQVCEPIGFLGADQKYFELEVGLCEDD